MFLDRTNSMKPYLAVAFVPILFSIENHAIATLKPNSSAFAFSPPSEFQIPNSEFPLQQGIDRFQIGDFQGAIEAWERALMLYRSQGNRTDEGAALANLGIAHRALGNYLRAIEYLDLALAIKQEMGDRQGESQILVNLGNTYENLGEYDRTQNYYDRSLEIVRELGDRQTEAIILNNVGAIYAYLEEVDRAVETYQQSWDISEEIGDREGIGHTALNLGTLYHAQDNLERAIEYYQTSLEIARELDLRPMESGVLVNLALVYAKQEKFDRALEYHQQSLALVRETNAPKDEAKILNNYAHTLLNAERFTEAETKLRQAITLLENLRQDLDDATQISIFDTQVLTYNLLQQVLIEQHKIESALEVSEWGRARAFAALLGNRIEPENIESPEPINLDRIRQIARDRNATLVEYSIVPDDNFLAQGKQQGKASELLIWVVQPTGEIAFRQVNLLASQLTLEELVSDNLEIILTGSRGQESTFSPGDTVRLFDDAPHYEPWEIVTVDTDSQTLFLRQSNWNEGLTIERPFSDVVADTATQHRRLQQLHELLIEPIADLLPANPDSPIIFIPHRELFLVPFPALQDADGGYLIEKHTPITAPSIQVLELTGRGDGETGGWEEVLVVGNPTMPQMPNTGGVSGEEPQRLAPLPHAEREAEAIAQLLDTQALTGDRATQQAISQHLPQAQLIHLATHGLLDDRRGIGSAIALAPTDTDDGWLTAAEIFSMRLNAELVVLSACNTGQGQITGDGVIGLSRSFMSAGVPSVIVSLWMVPDAPTADLMTAFYQHLPHQPDTAGALRQAMLDTLEKHPNPRNWAAFALVGEP